MDAMDEDIEFLPEETLTSPRGFLAGATHAGIRRDMAKMDLGILYSEAPCSTAALYTNNRVKAAPLLVTAKHLADGRAQAIIANSGCANAATGPQGLHDALEMAQLAASKLGISPFDVVVASTGVIGTSLPMDRVRQAVTDLELVTEGGLAFARAIMTTDTRPKYAASRFTYAGRQYTTGGVAKGAGMIHPDLATMFCFLTSDAPVAQPFLAKTLREAVDASFNMIDVDGDSSTNDMVMAMASGLAGGEAIDEEHPAAGTLTAAVEAVCLHLAQAIVADAEGGTKVIQCRVAGASSRADARRVAREVVRSLGVKTAIYGQDPNWGRILAAVGNSGTLFEEDKVALWLHDQRLFARGGPQEFDTGRAKAHLEGAEISIRLDLGLGQAQATGWGSDLTEEYVRLNSRYTT
jgi:glutamate N-acetyltransferase/amino-acid N-acetyltransferase